MSKRQLLIERGEASVQNWLLELPPFDRDFTLSPLEKTALATWKAQGKLGHYSRKIKNKTKQQLKRLTQPIEAALLYYGITEGPHHRQACVLLLLHEMHQRQTSLWAWDANAWVEIVGNSSKEFRSIHHACELSHNISFTGYRSYVMACAYLLSEIPIYQLVTGYSAVICAQNIFGGIAVEKVLHTLKTESIRIARGLGAQRSATCMALLANRSPDLEKLTLPVLEKLHETCSHHKFLKNTFILVSRLLYNLNIIPSYLPTRSKGGSIKTGKDDVLSADWVNLIQACHDHSTNTDGVRRRKLNAVAKAARWAAEKYPDASSPHQWTRSMAIAYVADVIRMIRGQWQHPMTKSIPKRGQPLGASYQLILLADLRLFFKECHNSDWIPRSFNPDRDLAIPRSILAKRRPNPRPIDSATWTKLQSAGLSLTKEDLPGYGASLNIGSYSWYPLEMVRAMAIIWLYTGLRSDEIRRLRVGCIRPIPREENDCSSSSTPVICILTVPQGKNPSGFSKPVLGVVGDIVEIWEKRRPPVPKHWDDTTSEAVDFLFVWRGEQVGPSYLNHVIIPMLCRKAGIPVEDALGKITSHRARHTLATQLSNAPTPMSDSDMQHWLGHSDSGSLQYYTHGNERKLREAYTIANHVSVDKRQIEQLKEPTTIGGTLATEGGSMPYVDLGHGFCAHPYFASCKRRKPCANCSFYKPKVSLYSKSQEAKSQLQRMLHSLPLSQEVRQAVEDAIAANEMLIAIMRRNQDDDSSKSEGSAAADIEGT